MPAKKSPAAAKPALVPRDLSIVDLDDVAHPPVAEDAAPTRDFTVMGLDEDDGPGLGGVDKTKEDPVVPPGTTLDPLGGDPLSSPLRAPGGNIPAGDGGLVALRAGEFSMAKLRAMVKADPAVPGVWGVIITNNVFCQTRCGCSAGVDKICTRMRPCGVKVHQSRLVFNEDWLLISRPDGASPQSHASDMPPK